MNKFLMMSLAAVAATAGATVTASATEIVGHSSGGGSYCDTITMTLSGSNNYADVHDWTPCGLSSVSYGMGISGNTAKIPGKKKKAKPNNVALSDYYVGDVAAGYLVDFQVGLPLKNGGSFNAYYTKDGVSITQYINGTYGVVGAGEKHQGHGKSTIDALREYVKSHQ